MRLPSSKSAALATRRLGEEMPNKIEKSLLESTAFLICLQCHCVLEQAHPSFVDVRILEGVRNPLAPFLSREGDKNPHCSAFTQSVQLDQVAPEVYRALSCICTIHVSDRIAVSRTENTLGLLC